MKQFSHFSDPRKIMDPDGIVLISDELSNDILHEAYSNGIFPWPHDDLPILWFCPEERGVLFFDQLHIPRSLKKELKKCDWTFKVNTSFDKVIQKCATKKRPGQDGTWITERLLAQYLKFQQAGFVNSVECWEGEQLIGGIYGVYIDGVFSGESMFFEKTNASKASFLALVYILKQMGLKWFDIQMVTPITESFGGVYLHRDEYLNLLEKSKSDIKFNSNSFHLNDLLSFF